MQLDRYIAICHSYVYHSKQFFNISQLRALLVATWFLTALLCALPGHDVRHKDFLF